MSTEQLLVEANYVIQQLAKVPKRITYTVGQPEVAGRGRVMVCLWTQASPQSFQKWFERAGAYVDDSRYIVRYDYWIVIFRPVHEAEGVA